MATLTLYQDFKEQLGKGVHNLASNTFKAALTNSAPNAATHVQLSDITQLSTGGGYTGGAGGVVIYNDTASSPADALVGYLDYGSSITLADTETFTLDFGASLLTVA
jgi:hypothetical protein